VHPGQDVEIKVDTFPFTRYGLIHGRVVSVSQDAVTRDKTADKTADKSPGAEITSGEPKGQELAFSARISLDRTQMQVEEHLVNLSAGMAVTVEIKTGTRAVITYLLSPLMRHKHETLTTHGDPQEPNPVEAVVPPPREPMQVAQGRHLLSPLTRHRHESLTTDGDPQEPNPVEAVVPPPREPMQVAPGRASTEQSAKAVEPPAIAQLATDATAEQSEDGPSARRHSSGPSVVA
jgi:Cation efflux system protein CusB domain 1